MKYDEDAIAETIEAVWATVLGIDVQAATPVDLGPERDETLCGCIHIDAGERLALVLRCSESLARLGASVMFDVPVVEVTGRDAREALSELTNITGGNIKALLPDGRHLSLPTVVGGRDYLTVVGGARRLASVHFRCGGSEFLSATLFIDDRSLSDEPSSVTRRRAIAGATG